MATYEDFQKLDIRVGRIVEVNDFPEANKSLYKLKIDFGPEIGIKNSAVGITVYPKEELIGKLVLGVVNFPPKKIAGFFSEVLTLGVPDGKGNWILVVPENKEKAVLGGRLA